MTIRLYSLMPLDRLQIKLYLLPRLLIVKFIIVREACLKLTKTACDCIVVN